MLPFVEFSRVLVKRSELGFRSRSHSFSLLIFLVHILKLSDPCMDGREAMATSGPASQYYIQYRDRGPGTQTRIHVIPNPSSSVPIQSSQAGGGSVESAIQTESSSPSPVLPHGVSVGGPPGASHGELVKKKRGRPRKYGPDKPVSLTLSPCSSTPQGSELATPMQKRGRGRPPGTGTKQQLASLGEWIAGSAGMGFTPHIITIAVGEDVATKIMSFSQQGPRAVCILSANGAVSTVTLRHPATSGSTVTYEGRFEILCMSGSYLLTDDGGTRSRSGGLSISLSSPDGRVIGGGVGGLLIAASPVQVIVGSFIYGGSRAKYKTKSVQEHGESEPPVGGEQSTPINTTPNQNLASPQEWLGSRQTDMSNTHVDIDLMRE